MSLPIKPHLARFIATAGRAAPSYLGTRYNSAGQFLAEPGNTIVSHLVPGSPSERAVIAVRDAMRTMPDAGHLAFTPVSSLHMTLFQGIIERRRLRPYWPEDVALDTSIDDMTRLYLDRLEGFKGAGPFRIRPVDVSPMGLIVAGATDADVRAMAAWRDALALPFGYRHPDHDDYVFHITIAYPVSWFAPERAQAWQQLLDDCLATLLADAPIIELQPPAFCSFADMNHFEELLVLG